MGFRFYSLKTGMVVCLSLLIILAMLLINVVMMKLAERDLLDANIRTARLLIHGILGMTGHGKWERLGDRLPPLLTEAGFSRVMVVGPDGRKVFGAGRWIEGEEVVLRALQDALRTGETTIGFSGRTWGVTWFGPGGLRVAGPVLSEGRSLGAAAVGADLGPMYRRLRSWEGVVLGYIFLNAAILVLFGVFLLSRTVIQPIRRLLAITEKFDDWPTLLPAGESSRNEFGQLFRSLKMMLNRLEVNKEEMKAHIASLEKANLEIQKAQGEVVRSEKMATAGRLATGVAHEIGNPLGIILGYVELLKRDDLSREERTDFLARVEAEVTRIHHIIRELLDFARGRAPEEEETAVHELILETLEMLKPQPLMAHIEIQMALTAENDRVRAAAGRLKQVFVNLVMNAADAMAGEGRPGDEEIPKVLRIETVNQDGWLRVSFTDTGTGIPEAHRDRVFDPFFTTKEPGKGTGLGLSVCYTIMKGLGGRIQVDSRPGKGATATVDIPLAVNKEASEPLNR